MLDIQLLTVLALCLCVDSVNRKNNEDIVWHFISNCASTLIVVNPILTTLSVGEREGGEGAVGDVSKLSSESRT